MTKKSEVKEGQVWTARINGRVVQVRVDSIEYHEGYKPQGLYSGRPTRPGHTTYHVTSLVTGRQTSFRSATKFRQLIKEEVGQ